MTTLQVEEYTLHDLAVHYFQWWKCRVERVVTLEGQSGTWHTFDLLVTDRSGLKRVVWVRDWKRSVGINIAIGLDVASSDVKLANPAMVAREFSEDARSYSKRRRVTVLRRREIVDFLDAHAF